MDYRLIPCHGITHAKLVKQFKKSNISSLLSETNKLVVGESDGFYIEKYEGFTQNFYDHRPATLIAFEPDVFVPFHFHHHGKPHERNLKKFLSWFPECESFRRQILLTFNGGTNCCSLILMQGPRDGIRPLVPNGRVLAEPGSDLEQPHIFFHLGDYYGEAGLDVYRSLTEKKMIESARVGYKFTDDPADMRTRNQTVELNEEILSYCAKSKQYPLVRSPRLDHASELHELSKEWQALLAPYIGETEMICFQLEVHPRDIELGVTTALSVSECWTHWQGSGRFKKEAEPFTKKAIGENQVLVQPVGFVYGANKINRRGKIYCDLSIVQHGDHDPFLELQTTEGPDFLTQLAKKAKCEIEIWEGPPEKRWGLYE